MSNTRRKRKEVKDGDAELRRIARKKKLDDAAGASLSSLTRRNRHPIASDCGVPDYWEPTSERDEEFDDC
jgi:hypothetical protein